MVRRCTVAVLAGLMVSGAVLGHAAQADEQAVAARPGSMLLTAWTDTFACF